MLVHLESLSAVLVMINSKSVSVCNRSHTRQANSGKITITNYNPNPRSLYKTSRGGQYQCVAYDRCYDHKFDCLWSRLRPHWSAWSVTSFGLTWPWSQRPSSLLPFSY